jgi:hypothetical protein
MKVVTSYLVTLLISFLACSALQAQETITVARIKYDGGGDWYGNRTTFVNLFNFMRNNTNVRTAEREVTVELTDKNLFNYPITYIAGHGNIKFDEAEVIQLRRYLTSGGFLWADDDYGMDPSFRREMKRVFPDLDWVEIPFSHPIYHVFYQFPNGLPKVHKHAGGPPHGLGLFYEGRMVSFYSFNTDISDGCEDPQIHGDPAAIRESALKMGTNIILWALTQ